MTTNRFINKIYNSQITEEHIKQTYPVSRRIKKKRKQKGKKKKKRTTENVDIKKLRQVRLIHQL